MNGPSMGGFPKSTADELVTSSGEDLLVPASDQDNLSKLIVPPSDKEWSRTEHAEEPIPHGERAITLGDLPRTALGYDSKGNAVSGLGE